MSNLKDAVFNRFKPTPVVHSDVEDSRVGLDFLEEILEQKCDGGDGDVVQTTGTEEFKTFEDFFMKKLPIVQETMALESAESAYETLKELWHKYKNRKLKRKHVVDNVTSPSVTSPSSESIPASTPIDASLPMVAAKKPTASSAKQSSVEQSSSSSAEHCQFGFKSFETWDEYVMDAVLSMGVFPQQPILRREKIALLEQYLVAQ